MGLTISLSCLTLLASCLGHGLDSYLNQRARIFNSFQSQIKAFHFCCCCSIFASWQFRLMDEELGNQLMGSRPPLLGVFHRDC